MVVVAAAAVAALDVVVALVFFGSVVMGFKDGWFVWWIPSSSCQKDLSRSKSVGTMDRTTPRADAKMLSSLSLSTLEMVPLLLLFLLLVLTSVVAWQGRRRRHERHRMRSVCNGGGGDAFGWSMR